jgi:hypothetical protein
MTAMNLRRKGLSRMQLYSMSKLATSNISISLCLLSPVPQDTSKSMRPIGVDDYPGMTPWNMSCIGIRSDKLRLISMKVFLMIRFNEAPLSINVLAILGRPIGNLTMNGKFCSDRSVSRWSSSLNDISTSDHFILLPDSMPWDKLISYSSFFPCVFKAMDMLPPWIMLISPIYSSLPGSTRWCSPHRGSWGTGVAGGGIFLRSRKVLHSFKSCPVV